MPTISVVKEIDGIFKSHRQLAIEKRANDKKETRVTKFCLGKKGRDLQLYRSLGRIAQIRALYGLIEDEVEEILVKQNNKCNGCAVPITIYPNSIDHVIPKCLGGMTKKENLQILCLPCNKAKGQMTMKDFIIHCRKVVIANKSFLNND